MSNISKISLGGKVYDITLTQETFKTLLNENGGQVSGGQVSGTTELSDTTVKLSEALYAYAPIGAITEASNTNRVLVANKDDTLKMVFNKVFGTQQDVQPTITTSGVYLSVSAGTTSYGGGEFGAIVKETDVTITFTLYNSATAEYGYRCGNTKTTTADATFKYAITKQSDADIKITLPSGQTATASMVTTGTCKSANSNILYCNFNSSNKVSIKIHLDAGSVTTSSQPRYGQIKGEVSLGAAQSTSGTAITKFLTYLENDATSTASTNALSGGNKSDTAGAYTIDAGSYYPYWVTSTSASLSSDLNNPVDTATRYTSGSSVTIPCTSASHIWFLLPPGTSGSKQIQYEPFDNTWVNAFGGDTDTTVGPVDVAVELNSNATVMYKGYYTSAKAAAGSSLNYKII